MSKLSTTKPVLIMVYGIPGAGKTHFSGQLAESMGAAHVQADRIRSELFEKPRYDKQEDEVVIRLMEYMAEEFLKAGVNVIYDVNAGRLVQRRTLRDVTRKIKGQTMLVWLQIDAESAFLRISKRDRRRNDDKYARPYTKAEFKLAIGNMQPPKNEDYVVVSGKHPFTMQRGVIAKKLYDLNLTTSGNVAANVTKPGLVNLVPTAGRVDMNRRNVIIR